jgi:hypothetical protein
MINKFAFLNFLSIVFIVLVMPCVADEFVKVKSQNGTDSPPVTDQTKWVVPHGRPAAQTTKKIETTTSKEPKPQLKPKIESPMLAAPPVIRTISAEPIEVNMEPETPVKPVVQAPATQIPVKSPASLGEIQTVNLSQKFVVVQFKKEDSIPPVGSKLGVYRSDTFIGSIELTQPIKPPYASADIVSGKIQSGDNVR